MLKHGHVGNAALVLFPINSSWSVKFFTETRDRPPTAPIAYNVNLFSFFLFLTGDISYLLEAFEWSWVHISGDLGFCSYLKHLLEHLVNLRKIINQLIN